ncbi:metallophosphoesterase [Paenibacillus curdlanolyticus YK9]|uniref:Metallophosphoesterase n=1 Tax=Paenibacillus curdlanolyticus YK9 TaxID=717606 RepID=E0IBW3_9BACL|nr:bifunctional UDP-sugar hydrolase/5'-nucleotidase [Paenibacillus curdlanolyticus]EFM10193.1 metallophosphoesterase [Paenibacillus curdlanolyticus YK9]
MHETREWPIEAVLLHSNDIHSRLENAARMATFIAEERRALGSDRVLVVDIGDHMDRMRAETEGSDGMVNVELLQAAGYEAITLGNNEGLTYESDALEAAYEGGTSFAVVVANMYRAIDHERPAWMTPSLIVRKGQLRIGIIGVTAQFTDFYTLLGWDVAEPLQATAEQVAQLRQQVDIVVVMSHLGLPFDRLMAEQVAGVDLILGGHTHHLLEEPLVIGQTTICAAGKFGEYMGRIEIGRDPLTGAPRFRAACVPMAAYVEHESAVDILNRYQQSAKRKLDQVIVQLDTALPVRNDQESPLPNLLAAGIRRWTGTEIGIVNAGQLLAGLAIGDVTAGELHAICPSPINPCRMRLLGVHIKTALEQSLTREFIEKAIRGFGFRGVALGTLAVDGLTIDVEPSEQGEWSIIAVHVGDEPLVEEREYEVGTIDMFTFGVGYESLKLGKGIQYFLPEFIRDVLARELQSNEAIQSAAALRWRQRKGRAAT